jgi:hypothetical protein
MFTIIISVLTPLAIVFFCYLRIFLFVRKCKKDLLDIQRGDFGKSPKTLPWVNEDFRLIKTLFLVFVVFLICWSPYAFINIGDFDDEYPKIAYVIAIQMAHGSSSLNSILYAATNKRFRDGYRRFLCGYVCRKRPVLAEEVRVMYIVPHNHLNRRLSKSWNVGMDHCVESLRMKCFTSIGHGRSYGEHSISFPSGECLVQSGTTSRAEPRTPYELYG